MEKLFRISDDIAEKLRGEAFRLRVSQNSIVNSLLEKHFKGGDMEINKKDGIQRRASRPPMAKETA